MPCGDDVLLKTETLLIDIREVRIGNGFQSSSMHGIDFDAPLRLLVGVLADGRGLANRDLIAHKDRGGKACCLRVGGGHRGLSKRAS